MERVLCLEHHVIALNYNFIFYLEYLYTFKSMVECPSLYGKRVVLEHEMCTSPNLQHNPRNCMQVGPLYRHAHILKSGAHEFKGPGLRQYSMKCSVASSRFFHLYSIVQSGVTQRSVPSKFLLVPATCHLTPFVTPLDAGVDVTQHQHICVTMQNNRQNGFR